MRKISAHKERCKYTAKERLLAAGERLFTGEGRTALTSRMIAEEAQVNHALIAYYYGGLGNLMEAVVCRCLEKLSDRLQPEVACFRECIASTEKEGLATVFRGGMAKVLRALQGEESARLLQALSAPESRHVVDVYPRFTEVVTAPLFGCFVDFLTRYREQDAGDLEIAVLAQVLVAHTMSFFRGAILVRRHLGCDELSDEQRSQITDVIVEGALALAGK